jgi:hypothetical protein
MKTISVMNTNANRAIKNGRLSLSILLVLSIKKIKRPASIAMMAPSHGKGSKYQ